MFCLCMSKVISSFRSLRTGSQVFAFLMLFLCVILYTMSSCKSLQLLCIFPFGLLCLSAISMMLDYYLFLSNVYYRIMFVFIVCYYMFTILDYSSALEYSIIRRYTNIVYYYYYYVCENSVGSVYIGGYGGLSESGLCVFRELCPVSFLVVGENPSVLL